MISSNSFPKFNSSLDKPNGKCKRQFTVEEGSKRTVTEARGTPLKKLQAK
jgi:hypothetical protein